MSGPAVPSRATVSYVAVCHTYPGHEVLLSSRGCMWVPRRTETGTATDPCPTGISPSSYHPPSKLPSPPTTIHNNMSALNLSGHVCAADCAAAKSVCVRAGPSKPKASIKQQPARAEAWGTHMMLNGGNSREELDWTAVEFSKSGGLLTRAIRDGLVTSAGGPVLKHQPTGKVRFDVDGYVWGVFKAGLIGKWTEIWGTSDMWFVPDPFGWLSEEAFCDLYWETIDNPEPTSMEATAAWCASLIRRFPKINLAPIENHTTSISNIIPTPSFFKAYAPLTPRSSGSGGNGSRHMLTAVGGGEEGSRRMLQRCKSVRVSATGDDELMC